MNISSPGWAKHAWSCFFAPWNGQACVFVANQKRFNAKQLLDTVTHCGVTTFCAPPTVWRMLIQEKLSDWKIPMRELIGAGEPLNPEVIEQVRGAWGITIRDGYGQTETTALVGNTPGQKVKPGSMGRPLPGYRVALLDFDDRPQKEAELCLTLTPRPTGLMQGYQADDGGMRAMAGDVYRSGDVASIDDDGYLTYIGRADDVFKSSDYRISPFELESVLIEHPAVAEAAVVPSPVTRRIVPPRCRFSSTAGQRWRLLNGCGGLSSPNCQRQSPVRSGESNCGGRKRRTSGAVIARLSNSGRRISPTARLARALKDHDPWL
jgi:acetyl-CoA synthetase